VSTANPAAFSCLSKSQPSAESGVASAKFVALQRTVAETSPTLFLTDRARNLQAQALFTALVNFVRDPAGLPDPVINSLGRVMRQSTMTLRTPVIMDPSGVMPKMVFAVSSRERDATAGLVLPQHFTDLVREDLRFQITKRARSRRGHTRMRRKACGRSCLCYRLKARWFSWLDTIMHCFASFQKASRACRQNWCMARSLLHKAQ
jgi:hypothetical protein